METARAISEINEKIARINEKLGMETESEQIVRMRDMSDLDGSVTDLSAVVVKSEYQKSMEVIYNV